MSACYYRGPERVRECQRVSFKTHAYCARRSSGSSGNCTETPPFAALNFTGVASPNSDTALTPVTSLIWNTPPGHRGRIAETSLPFEVKNASIFDVSFVTSYSLENSWL